MKTIALLLAVLVACKDKQPAPPAKAVTTGDAATDAAKQLTITELLEEIRSELKTPALALAVWRDGKLLDNVAIGLRKVDDAASKVTTKDYWHLGSNTKAMTATLIAIFVDRGKLKWDDTIGKFWKKVDPGYAKVTLDQLLRHEGGAPAAPPEELWKQLWDAGDKPDARDKFVQGILAKPPAQAPGNFEYSNQGYMIAGVMLEKATGKKWEQLMRDELFAKLDMKSCGFGAPGRKDIVDQPWGHDGGGTPIAPGPAADNPPGVGPAGTVHCSLEDYGKFLNMFSTGQPALVPPEAMQHLLTPRSGNYAGGWMKLGAMLLHSGSNTMWYATAGVTLTTKPEHRLVLVLATNSGAALDLHFGRILERYTKQSE